MTAPRSAIFEIHQGDYVSHLWRCYTPGGNVESDTILWKRPGGLWRLVTRIRYIRDSKVWGSADEKQVIEANAPGDEPEDAALAVGNAFVSYLCEELSFTERIEAPIRTDDLDKIIKILSAQPGSHPMDFRKAGKA